MADLTMAMGDPFWENFIGHNLYQTHPFEEEIITDTMSLQKNEASSVTVDHTFISEAQFPNEMLPDEDVLFCTEIPIFEGAQPVKICGLLRDGEKEDDIELIQLLLAAGRMIGEGNYDHAAWMVCKSKNLSNQFGNPTQRLAYYMSGALQERIELQALCVINSVAKPVSDYVFNIDREIDQNEFRSLAAYYNNVLHYIKLLQFTSVQAVIDAVGNARKIHLIDLGIRSGSHWTVLMEHLSHRAVSSSVSSLDLLRITAVGMNGIELRNSGKRLYELANTLGIPFSYNIVEVRSMEEIKEDLFVTKSCEALAVYSSIVLRSLLYNPVLLHNLLSVIKKLKPRIMVSVEIEAQHNSPSFVNRFSEVFSYYVAYFDLLDVTMTDRNDIRRVKHEELCTGSQMRSMIVYEGKARSVRHVRIDVWRCLFEEAGFREMSFSFQAMYQAGLLLGEYASGEYYTVEPNGHAKIIKWKGTPLFSISAWSACKSVPRK